VRCHTQPWDYRSAPPHLHCETIFENFTLVNNELGPRVCRYLKIIFLHITSWLNEMPGILQLHSSEGWAIFNKNVPQNNLQGKLNFDIFLHF
jgi:hypothetical protein